MLASGSGAAGGTGGNGNPSGGNGGSGGNSGNLLGVVHGDALDILNSTISGNTLTGGSGGDGGNGGNAAAGTSGTPNPGNGGAGGNGSSARGAGIAVSSGTVNITSSTIAGNAATGGTSGSGGTGGSGGLGGSAGPGGSPGAALGGGLFQSGGTVTLVSTILADNTAAFNADVSGSVNADYCLIENVGTATITGANNVTGMDPALSALADNGGPTFTQALTAGSPAIGMAQPTGGPTTDQRGYTRDAAPDIGAFEFGATAPKSGGGGDGKDDSKCSTGTERGPAWMLLAGLLALLGFALRTAGLRRE
jgi:hypothetical protein